MFKFNFKKDEKHICNGDNFADAYLKFKNNKQLVAIGINCSSPSNITSLLRSVYSKEENSLPFIVYPTLGENT
jgi:homocysteine S-methyltransferase